MGAGVGVSSGSGGGTARSGETLRAAEPPPWGGGARPWATRARGGGDGGFADGDGMATPWPQIRQATGPDATVSSGTE